MDDVQLIYPYYENPGMLERQIETWNAYPWQLKERTKIILIDDGSPNSPALDVVQDKLAKDVNLEVYRIHEDKPWNQNGAHNLGFHIARDGWCLSTDIDHVVAPSQLNLLFDLDTDESKFYTFARRQVRNIHFADFKRHPNSWLLTRKMFWDSGGYDEDFAGYYGSDSLFRRALMQVGKRVELDIFLIVYDEEDLPDANTRHFGEEEEGGIRKKSKYHSASHPHLAKKRRHSLRAENPLRFKWDRVYAQKG